MNLMTKQANLWLKGMYIVNTAWKYVGEDYGIRKKLNNMPVMKQTKNKKKITIEAALNVGIQAGLSWYTKLRMRCLIEGCRYGNEFEDKEPKDECIYCGEPNYAKKSNEFFGDLIKKQR